MTKFEALKRPEIDIERSSIKPALGKAVEFYTNKVGEYRNALSDLGQYSDRLEALLKVRDNEIIDLKSQIQQQAPPVVPECVDSAIKSLPDHYSAFEAISLIKSKVETLTEENEDWLPVYNWLCDDIKNQDIFALAFITGKYEVEKPQLFYMKHVEKSQSDENEDWYLSKAFKVMGCNSSAKGKLPIYDYYKFTQQEIDLLTERSGLVKEAGIYEQIKVVE
jgi:Protein of unknown function (DUF1642).